MVELLVARVQRDIRAWQAKEGMPDEEIALIARLEQKARGPEGLNGMTLYRMDALLKDAGWGDDHA